MNKKEMCKVFKRIKKVKIAVLGDFCLDAYWEIDTLAAEISVETGLPTQPVREHRYSPGGAGNVAANLATLGVGEVHAFGVLGQDLFAQETCRILQQLSIQCEGLQYQKKEWQTCVYIKRIVAGKERNRIDFGNFNHLQTAVATGLLQSLQKKLPELDAVIINQQLVRGIHTRDFRRQLVALVEKNPQVTFITDSRDFGDDFHGTMRKINDREACILCGFELPVDSEISYDQAMAATKQLTQRWREMIFVTCGAAGVLIGDGGSVQEVPAEKISGPVDTVGAGDTLLAGLTAALAAGAAPVTAAKLGTLAAAVSVRKLYQCGAATPQEILQLLPE